MRWFKPFLRRVGGFASGRIRYIKRSPKIFIPTPQKWIVIPYKPLSAFLILILTICSIYLIFRSDIFLVRTIRYISENEPKVSVLTEKDLAKVLDPYVTRSIFTIDLQGITRELMGQFLALESVRVVRSYPDKLVVYWRQRQPVVQINKGGEKMLVDAGGLIYAHTSLTNDLPEIYGFTGEDLGVGKRLDSADLSRSLMVIERLTEEEISIDRLELKAGGILELYATEDWKVFFSLNKNIEDQLLALIAVVNQYKKEGTSFTEVDLRYKFPVVR